MFLSIMAKILLVYLPFCTPASPPYSITNLYSFLKSNSMHDVEVMDLNLEFHKLKFPKFQKYFQDIALWENYNEIGNEFRKLTAKTYSENNKRVVNGDKPEMFKTFLQKIKESKADIVAFSIVYSSQVFYAYSLIKELENVKCVVGGPAVSKKLADTADATFSSESEFLNYLSLEKVKCSSYSVDFSIWVLQEYFVPSPVIPLKTTSTCYYRGCTFCSHFSSMKYQEYPLGMLKKTILDSKQKNFFLIDDMIPVKRLLELALLFKELKINWACQLRPTKDLSLNVLKILKTSGLNFVIWGVESGNQRILNLMKKGTIVSEILCVLRNSYLVGVKNVVYMMAGFPTETKDEFLESIEFLKENRDNIDLISYSVFGLQKSFIYDNPQQFGITKIIKEQRTILDPSISYKVSLGLSHDEANALRDKFQKTIEKINKYPKAMNFFREHMFF